MSPKIPPTQEAVSLSSKVMALVSSHPPRDGSPFRRVLHTFFLWLICLMLAEHHTVIHTQVNIYMQVEIYIYIFWALFYT